MLTITKSSVIQDAPERVEYEVKTIHCFIVELKALDSEYSEKVQELEENYGMGLYTTGERANFHLSEATKYFINRETLVASAMDQLQETREFLQGAACAHYCTI